MTSTSPAETVTGSLLGSWPFETEDDLFLSPFLDIDEWRDGPVRHRYVHGGFAGTQTLFSFYFPEQSGYEGRFFQHVTPFPQSEDLAPLDDGEHNKIAFAIASGAYFVETNGGGGQLYDPASADPSIGAYRANAASADFSRRVAQRLFGDHRVYGYLYGGSGGGYRSIGAAENTEGVWDGFAPHVIGSSVAIPNVFTVRMHAMRLLRDKLPQIVDAYDVGGDPAALDLSEEEADAFAEVTRMGFPPRSWFGWKTMGMHGFRVLYPGVMAADPTYSEDFWTKDGYLGADPGSSVHRDRIQHTSTIVELLGSAENEDGDLVAGSVDESFLHSAGNAHHITGVRLAETPTGWLLGGQLDILSGTSAGRTVQITAIENGVIEIEPGQGDVLAGLSVGDEVTVDTSSFLAVQTYHRHQVPGPDFPVWDQFRDEKGEPALPQRPVLLGPLLSRGASGSVQTGRIAGKMIVVSTLLDREAFAWQADWYRRKVLEHLGDETGQFRLWYIDNALHGDDGPQEFPARSIAYVGALETALRQLAAWVERGVEPAPTTAYEVVDGQVLVPASVEERHGVQPTVALSVNDAESAHVKVGEPVSVRVEAEAADGGVVVELREVTTTADGEEVLGAALALEPGSRVATEYSVTFDAPGTRFLAVRVTAQTDGDPSDRFGRVENIARARVIVDA
ncbi:hypothetical protein [Rathayibacter sp. VKM Ac-2760]|uniref:hypothetical protein n=1 Tax=Rathayibacter sp. VKM Ac-2760 TaxID=2609253 RepID=UPI001FC9791B|nr:hypothetical protein [Rathayibacter sp. VKM Ac-2760]